MYNYPITHLAKSLYAQLQLHVLNVVLLKYLYDEMQSNSALMAQYLF